MKYLVEVINRVSSGELERKDLPAINKWRNEPELIALLGAPFGTSIWMWM